MPADAFRLFVDVDLPLSRDSYKGYRRDPQRGQGSIYVTSEDANVQLWLNGSPKALRLLATMLTEAADVAESDLAAEKDEDSVQTSKGT